MLQYRSSVLFYLFFIALAVIGIIYGSQLIETYPDLRLWPWSNIALITIGIPFLFFQKPARLPELWDAKIPISIRILQPVLIGIVFGLADLILIEYVLRDQPHTSLPPYTQPFPYSIFLYSSGAFEIELFYRLIPVTLVLLIFAKIKEGKYWLPAFWIIAILSSIREPIEQLPGGPLWFIIYAVLSGFAMNFIQVWYYRKAGFSASLFLRLGHYMVWHILNGILIEQTIN
ncbi:hypothetical protein [Flavihumibacter sp. UBA7668]|uniref:hypothetical protein n=1 Tax=Flavihumibacter sp. UBA7668 TaxID=1946542 RepID=UPI0025BBB1C9|nr:hypothetical protein [Flavihumibacter sp. UBA7668]